MIELMKISYIVISFIANCCFVSGVLAKDLITELWSIENTFSMPESAVYDHDRKQVFISNVNHYAEDGNGFISRVSHDGKDVEQKWLTGLNSPTGLAIRDGLLYAVDYKELLIIDIVSKKIVQRAASLDPKPSLNDVAISSSGEVFVTGSSSASIYVLQGEKLVVWKHDKNSLKHANGLLVDGDHLVFGGVNWLKFDLTSKAISADFKQGKAEITEIDGITSNGCGGYFITLIDDERLWQVNKNGEAHQVSEISINGIDIDYFDNKLYIPVVGGGLRVFAVDSAYCQK